MSFLKTRCAESTYIIKRKWKAFWYGILFYLCRIFPVEQNKVVIWTFEGKSGYCCNPKYIADELVRRDKGWKIVWLVSDMGMEFPEGIEKMRNTLWNRVFQFSTAKFWIGNTRTQYGTKKRKGQIYIQTWHGTVCIKPIGNYRGSLLPRMARIVSEADSELIDYVLSGSDWCDMHYPEGLLYRGDIIRTGTPRCDILINRRRFFYMKVREDYGLPKEARIMLYAPTFRGGSQTADRTVSGKDSLIDYDKLVGWLENKFGGRWYIFLRQHPQVAFGAEGGRTDIRFQKVIDVTRRVDMNELLAGADAFITDYSSAVFEAALLPIPCFIYADDMDKYVEDRGKLFFDFSELPFPAASDIEGLSKNILCFDEREYREKLEKFMETVGIREDGHACERVVDLMVSCKGRKEEG